MSTQALEKLAQKKRREIEIKKIQKEREEEERAKTKCCTNEIESGSEEDLGGEEVELYDEDDSSDDDSDGLALNRGGSVVKVGRKRVSLGSKKDKLVCGIKPLPFFFLLLFMFVPLCSFLDKLGIIQKLFPQQMNKQNNFHVRTPKQQEWFVKIKAYYEDVNPAKLGEVPYLMHKYKGREEKLYKALRKKYEKDYDPHKTRTEF
jgi:hypothetical protein